MTDNRRVGSPKNNPGRMEPRSVAVQKDKPRINDERKVRPHAAGHPSMGIRPSGGAQKPSGEFSDKLAGEYIQARDVSMASIHENEGGWLARKGFQHKHVQGLYNHNHYEHPNGSWIQIGHNGQSFAHRDEAGNHHRFNDQKEFVHHLKSHFNESATKMNEADLAEWNPFERFLKPAAAQATPMAAPQGDNVERRMNRLEKQVDTLQSQLWRMGRSMHGLDKPAAPAAAPAQTPEPTPAPRRRPAPAAPSGTPWGHRGEPMQNSRKDFWDRRAGGGTMEPPMHAPRPTPAAPVAAAPAAAPKGPPSVEEMLKVLRMWKPGAYMNRQLTPYQIERAYRNAIQAEPSLADIREGYPDTSYEKCEPAHASRIGDIGSNKGKGKQPHWPASNKGFMQAHDLHIEKVTETANSDMENMIIRTMRRLGLEEDMHGGPEVDRVTLPAHWASALINGDVSGLDDDEADQARMMMHKLATDGWQVVGTHDEEPRFTWNYQVHNPHSPYKGGDVMDFIVHRHGGAGMAVPPVEGGMPPHMESYTGSVRRGPQGAAPIAETKIPRTRARWV